MLVSLLGVIVKLVLLVMHASENYIAGGLFVIKLQQQMAGVTSITSDQLKLGIFVSLNAINLAILKLLVMLTCL